MQVQTCARAEREAVVDTLVSAFRGYPVMRFVLGERADDASDAHLRALVGYYVDRRFLQGWPVLALRGPESMRAAILVSEPGPWDEAIARRELAALRALIGNAAFERMQRFEAASDANEPASHHLFVGMVGVRPEWRGRGYGLALLDHVRELARAGGYDGVCLSTEDPDNLAFYARAGFAVVSEARVDTLTTWCLYRDAR